MTADNQISEVFLESTFFIDYTHPEIQKKAEELIRGLSAPESRAESIFYYIRDQIVYTFRIHLEPDMYRASSVLRMKSGFCVQKAVLFCAFARAADIPAGLFFYDIRDYTLPEQMKAVLKTDVLYYHAVAALYLGRRWIPCDATLHNNLIEKKGLMPVFFSPTGCLMHSVTADGKRHVDYIHKYGLYEDVPLKEMLEAFKNHYPHLYQKHIHLSRDFNWEDEKSQNEDI